jgi:hypothetical protein
LGDHGRRPENADAYDQAHDDHRRVEGRELRLDRHDAVNSVTDNPLPQLPKKLDIEKNAQ